MSSSPSGLTFVDASGWIALVNRNDGLHQQAARLFQQRLDEGRGFVTSSVVLLEVGNWLSPVPLRPLASRLLERIDHSQRIEATPSTRPRHTPSSSPAGSASSLPPLNLIPGGQLDGVAHILYALSPRLHRVITNILPFLLFVAGAIYSGGSVSLGKFLIPALRHPKVSIDSGPSHRAEPFSESGPHSSSSRLRRRRSTTTRCCSCSI